MKLCVIGTGYLGAVHAACMADLGFEVVGVDTDARKVAELAAGRPTFFEPGFEEILRRNVAAGRLRFTTDFTAAADADVHFLAVGTPQRADGHAADLRYVHGALRSLAPHLAKPAVIAGKSTVPVGTAAELTAIVQSLAPAGSAVEVAWNPEFLREGYAVQDTLTPDRIVIGVAGPRSETVLREVYASIIATGTPFLVTDLQTAELVKVAANAFLATKISFINAMAEICEAAGADVTALADAIGHDPRIGRRFLNAGIGFGGACLPKDIRAFTARAAELGVPEAVSFLHDVDAINIRRRARTVAVARDLIGGDLTGRPVTVLGAAFKPDTDDVRDSPALEVARTLVGEGADVRVHDPKALDNAARMYPGLGFVEDLTEALRGADLVLHLTEWRDYRDLDPAVAGALVRGRRLVDGRNALDLARWQAAGWDVRALGRPGTRRTAGTAEVAAH